MSYQSPLSKRCSHPLALPPYHSCHTDQGYHSATSVSPHTPGWPWLHVSYFSKKCWAFGPGILCCNSTWSKRDNQPSPCGQQTMHYHTGAPFLYCALHRSVNLIYFHHLWSCGKSICSRVISFGIWLALALSISHELFPKKNQMCTTCSLHGINAFQNFQENCKAKCSTSKYSHQWI